MDLKGSSLRDRPHEVRPWATSPSSRGFVRAPELALLIWRAVNPQVAVAGFARAGPGWTFPPPAGVLLGARLQELDRLSRIGSESGDAPLGVRRGQPGFPHWACDGDPFEVRNNRFGSRYRALDGRQR